MERQLLSWFIQILVLRWEDYILRRSYRDIDTVYRHLRENEINMKRKKNLHYHLHTYWFKSRGWLYYVGLPSILAGFVNALERTKLYEQDM